VKCRGTLSFEGRTVGGIGYVTQNDFLLPFLTVRETLLFSAKLKTKFVNNQSDDISKVKYNNKADQIHEIVDKIILDLGLKECAATIIGGEALGKRGVSGGEKRRVSVAIQIITDPEVGDSAVKYIFFKVKNYFHLILDNIIVVIVEYAFT